MSAPTIVYGQLYAKISHCRDIFPVKYTDNPAKKLEFLKTDVCHLPAGKQVFEIRFSTGQIVVLSYG